MVSPTKRWLVATITAVLAAVAGCSAITGGSAPSTPSAPSAGSDAAGDGGSDGGGGACGSESGFCITVDIAGATTVQGTAQTMNLGTCADYVKGESAGGCPMDQRPQRSGAQPAGSCQLSPSGSRSSASLGPQLPRP